MQIPSTIITPPVILKKVSPSFIKEIAKAFNTESEIAILFTKPEKLPNKEGIKVKKPPTMRVYPSHAVKLLSFLPTTNRRNNRFISITIKTTNFDE